MYMQCMPYPTSAASHLKCLLPLFVSTPGPGQTQSYLVPFIFGQNNVLVMEIGWTDVATGGTSRELEE